MVRNSSYQFTSAERNIIYTCETHSEWIYFQTGKEIADQHFKELVDNILLWCGQLAPEINLWVWVGKFVTNLGKQENLTLADKGNRLLFTNKNKYSDQSERGFHVKGWTETEQTLGGFSLTLLMQVETARSLSYYDSRANRMR